MGCRHAQISGGQKLSFYERRSGTCPTCGAVLAETVHVCPTCGDAGAKSPPERGTVIAGVIKRRILMLPAAALATYLTGIVYDVMRPSIAAYGGIMFIADIVAAAGMGGVFVVAGAYVAPSRKRAVPVALGVLYCAAVAGLVYLTASNDDYIFEPNGPQWLPYLSLAAGVAGAIIAAVTYEKD